MRKTLLAVLIIVVALGGLKLVSAKRAPKPPPPTSQQIWAAEGIPVETASVVRGDMDQSVEVTGDINALDTVTLSAKIAGRVAAVMFREGDRVARGTTVIMLDQQDALSNLQAAQSGLSSAIARLSQARTTLKVTDIQSDAAIRQAKAALESAQARLDVVKNPSRSQERMVAENNVASAQANLENAEANFKRNQQLIKEGAISAAAFDVVKAQYTVAQSQYKSAKEQLSLIKEGGRKEDILAAEAQVSSAREQLRTANANAAQSMLRKEDIKAAQAGVEQAKATLALAQQQLSNTYIKSTISGQLASRQTEPGQVVAPGQALGQVVNLASTYFKGDVSETAIAHVTKGQTVDVQIDALPGRAFKGVVNEIFPAGSTLSRNFPVRIRILGRSEEVKPGMFARGRIITGVHRGVILIPKDAVDERHGTKMVFVLNGKNTVRRQDIDVINESRDYVEVAAVAGLNVGDTVVTAGRQNLQDGSKVKVGRVEGRVKKS